MTARATNPTAEGSLRPALAGAAATFAGIGLARFAYVPLFPAMVGTGWVTGAGAGLLGAANFVSYLLGVLSGRALARRIGTAAALDAGMALAVLAFAACAWNGGLAWLAAWRAAAGIAGGVLMGLAGPAVQGAVASAHRGRAGGLVMTGVGAGIVAGSLAVPALLGAGVGATWLALAGTAALLLLVVHPLWPDTPIPATADRFPPGTMPLCLAYGISGAGFVPHMVYFADLVVRGRGFAVDFGALAWLLFGVGALLGPVVGGAVGDRWGALPALRLWLGIQVVGLAAALGSHPVLLAASALLAGFSAVGLTAITLLRARELAGPGSGAIWVRATASFAIAQAVTAVALAAAFGVTGSHDLLFVVGLALSALSLVPVLRAGTAAAGRTAT